MKWFGHSATARNDIKIKKLVHRFGAEGYGVYFTLLEIIAEHIEPSNPEDWGYVDKTYDKEYLAMECGIQLDKFTEILVYCNQLGLLEKKDGRLYCGSILKRMDQYTSRFYNRYKKEQSETTEQLHTNNVETTPRIDKIRTEEKREEQKSVVASRPRNSFEKDLNEVIELLEKILNTKITNIGKQKRALKMIYDAGFTLATTKKIIKYMAEKDEFFNDKGFDLMTVANQLPRYKAEFEKQRQKGVT